MLKVDALIKLVLSDTLVRLTTTGIGAQRDQLYLEMMHGCEEAIRESNVS